MRLSADLLAFQGRLGHSFRKPDLLLRAVTHSSIGSATRPDNQRLEFLGDRVLGLVMAEALLAADPKASEGQLAPRFNALVRKETCADVAREVGLGDVLKLGRRDRGAAGSTARSKAEHACRFSSAGREGSSPGPATRWFARSIFFRVLRR